MGKSLEEACDETVQYVLRKLNAGDGLSCLLWVDCETGENVTVYIQDSMEEAMALLKVDLSSYYQNVNCYVIAFDGGWFDKSGIEHRAVFADMEDRASGSIRRLAYVIDANEEGVLAFSGTVYEFPAMDWSLFRVSNK